MSIIKKIGYIFTFFYLSLVTEAAFADFTVTVKNLSNEVCIVTLSDDARVSDLLAACYGGRSIHPGVAVLHAGILITNFEAIILTFYNEQNPFVIYESSHTPASLQNLYQNLQLRLMFDRFSIN